MKRVAIASTYITILKRDLTNENTTHRLMASTQTARRYHGTHLLREIPFEQQPLFPGINSISYLGSNNIIISAGGRS